MADIPQRVIDLASQQLGTAVTRDSTFAGLGVDSLDAAELVMELEEEFDIDIPDETAEAWVTIGQMVDYVEGRVAAERGVGR